MSRWENADVSSLRFNHDRSVHQIDRSRFVVCRSIGLSIILGTMSVVVQSMTSIGSM